MLESDEQALTQLLKTGFTLFKNEDYWVWKYKLNPNFDSSLVIIAENGEKIVGCNHWLARELKVSNQFRIKAALAGDLLVHPDHRGCGLAAELLRTMRSSQIVKEKGLVLTYMFAPLKLNNRLYEPVAGYIAAPNSTCTYKKLFSCMQLKAKISGLDSEIKQKSELKEKLKNLQITALFRLAGSPPFLLNINQNGVSIDENIIARPEITIEGTLPLSSSILEGKMSSKKLVWALITGKLKIRKGILKIFKLRRGLRLLQSALE